MSGYSGSVDDMLDDIALVIRSLLAADPPFGVPGANESSWDNVDSEV